jgi:hypothetical protein
MSDALFESVPDYDPSIPGARGVGGIAVDRHTGDLIACLNGPPFGVYRSSDAGETWTRIDDGNVEGGWVRSAAIQIDQTNPGRMAFFRVGPPAPMMENGRKMEPKSAMTLDGGETWQVFARAKQQFDLAGWVHGHVDWKQEDPQLIMAQERVRPSVVISTNGGEEFGRRLGKFIQEFTWNHVYAKKNELGPWDRFQEESLTGYGVCGGNLMMGRRVSGIELSTDGGETFETVSELQLTTDTPVIFKDKLYWGTATGLAASPDCGKTWAIQGAELPNIVKGPFFGADENEIVVVTEDGIYGTRDAAATWVKIADHAEIPEAWRSDADPKWLRQDYAWDHRNNTLYAAGMASPIYKFEIR